MGKSVSFTQRAPLGCLHTSQKIATFKNTFLPQYCKQTTPILLAVSARIVNRHQLRRLEPRASLYAKMVQESSYPGNAKASPTSRLVLSRCPDRRMALLHDFFYGTTPCQRPPWHVHLQEDITNHSAKPSMGKHWTTEGCCDLTQGSKRTQRQPDFATRTNKYESWLTSKSDLRNTNS